MQHAKLETREAMKKVGSLHDKIFIQVLLCFIMVLCAFMLLPVDFDSALFENLFGKKVFNLISGFIYRKSAMLARKN